MLLKDCKKSEEINHFSQESKDLITEMGNNEIFEFHETSSKRQCPDCAACCEIGIVYCTCGKCMQPSERNRQLNKDRFDSLSILGYVIKKNQSRGPRHGQSMRQVMYPKACDMLRKAKLPKNGSCETILGRWSTDAVYQKSLSGEGWTEVKIRQYDALALEDHSYEATPAERGPRQRNWKIVLEKGVQGPIRQRPDLREAKHAYRRLYKEHVESTGQGNKSIHPAQQRRQNSQQQFDEHEECAFSVHPRIGWRCYPSTSSSSSSQWQQNNEWESKQNWGYWRSSTWTEQ